MNDRLRKALHAVRRDHGSLELSKALVDAVHEDRGRFLTRLEREWESLNYATLDPVGQAVIREVLRKELAVAFPEAFVQEVEPKIPGDAPVRSIQLESVLEQVTVESLLQFLGSAALAAPDKRLLEQVIRSGVFAPKSLRWRMPRDPQGGQLAAFLANVIIARLVVQFRQQGMIVWRGLPDRLLVLAVPRGSMGVQASVDVQVDQKRISSEQTLGDRSITVAWKSVEPTAEPDTTLLNSFWGSVKKLLSS